MSTSTSTRPTPAVAGPVAGPSGGLRLWVLGVGPVLTWVLLAVAAQRAAFPDTFALYGAAVAVYLWSPLPLSLPAVLLDQERAAALPGRAWPVRAVGLLPWLLARSPHRTSVAVSLAGWVALVGLVALF